ncbi:CML12, partial [Symbiodinium sp. KB8]
MKGFTREVLRDIPKDLTGAAAEEWIYKFGVSYFSGQQNSQREAAKADLGQEIRAIFKAVDKDGNGVLDVKEFRSLLSAFTKELGLSKESALLVMAEADSDGDGKISYEEFVPLAIDVIEAIRAKKASAKEESERKAEALQELEAQLLEAFEEADEDRSGNLSRDEFYTALKHSGLGLTRKEMNVLMTMVWPMNLHVSHSHRISMRLQVDEDADGSISYAEFVPVGINTLIEVISQEIAYSQVSMEEADIRGHLQTVFMTMDTKGTGKLSRDEIADCLAKADLGLRPVQQYAILSEAVADEDGLVNYVDFASI